MTEGKRDKPNGSAVTSVKASVDSLRQEQKPISKVSEGRRRFAKAGLLAPPILMSVASRPVLGAGIQCLSNALSGNLSQPNQAEHSLCQIAECVDWTNATNWPTIANTITGCDGSVTIVPDKLNDESLPESCSECINGPDPGLVRGRGRGLGLGLGWNEKKCSGGTAFNEVFCSNIDEGRSMYRILCEDPGSEEAAITKALLYSLKNPDDYPLRYMQVQALWAGDYDAFLSHFGGLKEYLATTWDCSQ